MDTHRADALVPFQHCDGIAIDKTQAAAYRFFAAVDIGDDVHRRTGFDPQRVERIRVFGPSLEGNLSGDDATRDVFVYLPPSYATETARRYPVVYFLHGYGATAEAYVNLLNLPTAVDKAIAAIDSRSNP